MKLFRGLLCAAVTLAVVGHVAPANAETVSLRLLHSTPVDLYEAVNEKFKADHADIELRSDPVPPDYDVLTQGLLRSGIVGDLPDVVFQGYNRAGITIERGLAIPLDEFIASEKSWETKGYTPVTTEMCALNGIPYGLPFATSVTLVYFNLDAVSRAGDDPTTLPTDWDGILALANDMQKKSPGDMSAFFDYAVTGNLTFQALIASLGGRMITSEGKVGFAGKEGLASLKLLARFGEVGQVDMSRSQAFQAFSAGKLGILISTSSLLPQQETQIAGRFALRVVPFPLSAPNGRIPAGGNCAMILTKDPAKQKAAWEYIKFASGPIGQTIVALKSGYIPMNTLAINDPKLLGDFYKDHPNYLVATSQVPYLAKYESFPGDNSLKITTLINEYLREVVTGKKTVEDVLANMTRDVEALLPN